MSEEEKNTSDLENEESQSFKVSDRRYSVTGYDAEETEEIHSNVSPTISNDRKETPDETENVSEMSQDNPEQEINQSSEETTDSPSEESKEEEEEKHFEMMIAILQANALGAMGLHPQTGEKVGSADPRAAKLFVDLFGMLEEKMKGNLTEEENDLLIQVLAALADKFVLEQKK